MCLCLFFSQQSRMQPKHRRQHIATLMHVCIHGIYYIQKEIYTQGLHLYTSRLMLFPFVVLQTLLFYLFSLSLSFFLFSLSILWPPFFSWCALHFGFLCVDCCCCCESLVYSARSPSVSLYPYCERLSAYLAPKNSPMYLTLCE